MVIHTVIPYEQIFGSTSQELSGLLNTASQTNYRQISGGIVELTKTDEGEFVSRLISTDPRLYLNPGYMPGSRFQQPPEGRGPALKG